MLVQLPLGLFLPVGAKLQVDEGKPLDLQVQTCEAQGCFAGSAMDAELLAAIKAGKQLHRSADPEQGKAVLCDSA
jgi:invasion protein IalB